MAASRAHGALAPTTEARLLARLRQRAGRHFALAEAAMALPGFARPLHIALPADADAPLEQLAAEQRSHLPTPASSETTNAAADARHSIASGAHMPYWALLWPSGLALAEALLTAPELAPGRRTLELGCGLGVTACAALHRGLRLWAADCFPQALLFCRYNALRNVGRVPHPLLLDWRAESGRAACLALAPFDLVLAADILYEREDLEPLLALVPRLLASGGECWLAEPGRRISSAFVAAARARRWHDRPSIYERSWPPDGQPARVTVHRYTMPSDRQFPIPPRTRSASKRVRGGSRG
ncbi:MAG: methyltransferase domain-containing protein [Ktedonobacterales bacterium]|nr:methyltransferase domain-containing protein [Ktedonobacterales bacterium]